MAEIRALRERQFEQALDSPDALQEASAELDRMADDALAEVLSQGVDDSANATTVHRRVLVRYPGSFLPLEIDFGTLAQIRERFEAAHQTRYGFSAGERELVIESLSVEAVGASEPLPETRLAVGDDKPSAVATVDMVVDGESVPTPLYNRNTLSPHQLIDGPAIIREETATTVVEKGWRATLDPLGQLILERIEPLQQTASIGTDADPVMLLSLIHI